MKLIITAPLGERLGGAEKMLWTLLTHVDSEHLTILVVFLQDGPFREELATAGVRTAVVRTGRLRHFWKTPIAILSLARVFRRERPDVLLNWMAKSHLYAAPAALLARVSNRTIWWQHGITNRHWMDRIATVFPARAIACSSHAAAHAQWRLRPRRKTFVVYPGITPPDWLGNGELAQRRIRKVSHNGLLVGIVGRLQPDKCQHRVIEAIWTLRERGHNVKGLVVGGDAWELAPEYEPSLRRLVGDLGLSDVITFTGHVPDALPLIATIDVLVNASVSEGCPLVLLEAMALGVPVVATADSGGPPEVIEHGRSGLLSPSSDPAQLANTLEQLVTNPQLRRSLSLGGRERYLAAFTAASMAQSFEDGLRALIGPSEAR
jgi:glycosyltransferase involved in cell wall biosynthesis